MNAVEAVFDVDNDDRRKRRIDRGLNLIGLITLVVTIVEVLLALVAIPAILNTSSDTDKITEGNEMAACRSIYRSKIDTAMSELVSAEAQLGVLTNEGFQAALDEDRAELDRVLAEAPVIRADLSGAISALSVATTDYATAGDRSLKDPQGFLATCPTR